MNLNCHHMFIYIRLKLSVLFKTFLSVEVLAAKILQLIILTYHSKNLIYMLKSGELSATKISKEQNTSVTPPTMQPVAPPDL
jgi:hypothetical protein